MSTVVTHKIFAENAQKKFVAETMYLFFSYKYTVNKCNFTLVCNEDPFFYLVKIIFLLLYYTNMIINILYSLK